MSAEKVSLRRGRTCFLVRVTRSLCLKIMTPARLEASKIHSNAPPIPHVPASARGEAISSQQSAEAKKSKKGKKKRDYAEQP